MVSSKFNKEICDDDTVEHEKLCNNARLTMMFLVPDKDKGIDEEEAPLEVIRRMNAMIKSIINKLPTIRLGPWKNDKKTFCKIISGFPEDVHVVEKYAFDFNCFISPGDRAYCRLHIFFDDSTNLAEINSIISGFKKPRIQFLQLSHSDALSPIAMGTFTGSVKEMAESPDFHAVFKKKFNLSSLGLWWTQPRAENVGSFTPKKLCMRYELDRSDVKKTKISSPFLIEAPTPLIIIL